MTGFQRSNTYFLSADGLCTAWLYLPKGVEKPPAVIMAHGFAAERSFRLAPYAEKFAAAGMAVLLFDYRNFGDSPGTPRQLVDPDRHLEDWKAAIAHMRGRGEVDGARLALWGTSFSGGHVIMAAAEDPAIKVIVAQVPYVGGLDVKLPLAMKLKAAWAVWRDKRKARRGGAYCIPAVGSPRQLGCMMAEEAQEFLLLVPRDSAWQNAVPARILPKLRAYQPREKAGQVKCPALVMVAGNDALTPAALAREAAGKMARMAVASYECGHFGLYRGALFEDAAARQRDFLAQYLEAAPADAGPGLAEQGLAEQDMAEQDLANHPFPAHASRA